MAFRFKLNGKTFAGACFLLLKIYNEKLKSFIFITNLLISVLEDSVEKQVSGGWRFFKLIGGLRRIN